MDLMIPGKKTFQQIDIYRLGVIEKIFSISLWVLEQNFLKKTKFDLINRGKYSNFSNPSL